MGWVHTGNQGYIGKEVTRTAGEGPSHGVWQHGSYGLNLSQYEFTDPTPVSTDLGWSHDTPSSNNEYVYGSRNIRIFYTDAYGTTTHFDQDSYLNGQNSYTDARAIGNTTSGIANAGALLVSNNNSKVGYKWVKSAYIKGFKAHGKYASRTFSNNGDLTIYTWDGSSWSTLESGVDISEEGTVDWGTSTIRTYNFVNGSVLCKGVAFSVDSISNYWAINYLAPIDRNNAVFLGHT